MPYQQLSEQERYVICQMTMARFSPADIARRLGRHRATICRELRRNRHHGPYGKHYLYDIAQRQTEQRRRQANEQYKLDHPPLADYVKRKLKKQWAPEQIAQRLLRDYFHTPVMHVSHETIYQWIYRHPQDRWYQYLRRQRPRRRLHRSGRETRGQIPGRVSISQRPTVVEQRRRFGDWESDTVEGAKGRGVLVTHVERKSRYLVVAKLPDKRAATLASRSIRRLGRLPQSLLKTLTCDNGKEFAEHHQIAGKLKTRVYFADPHAPWQRATNENTNGLLRQFFPKGTDFSRVSHRQVAKVQRLLNNRPRKCLNYRTPAEVLSDIPGVALRI